MHAEKLSITLPAEMARMIRREVESGAYASDSEVIRDAVQLWQEGKQDREQRLQAIRSQIAEAAENPKRITDEELRQHFGTRFAEAEKKRTQ